MPNREVKPCSADGTGVTPGRVGRRLIYSKASFIAGFFAFNTFWVGGYFLLSSLKICIFHNTSNIFIVEIFTEVCNFKR
ncbi:MAG: hypothetical protein ACI9UV_001602 [Algoriphagus sp.]